MIFKHFMSAASLAAALTFAIWSQVYPVFGAPSEVFKVNKFAVEASAENAVAAKKAAMKSAEQGAFQLLLRRLVPVTRFNSLPNNSSAEVSGLIDGFSVRDERNSRTKYIATLDFSFNPDAVRTILTNGRLPFVEEQAPKLSIVPLSFKRDGALETGFSGWRQVWTKIDLEHSLTPAKVAQLRAKITPELVSAMLSGDQQSLTSAKQLYAQRNILFAILQPREGGDIEVALFGEDAVGPIELRRTYRGDEGNPTRAMKRAAAITLSILEGRWKSVKAPATVAAIPTGPVEPVLLTVEFSSFSEWQKIRGRLSKIPGVSSLEVGSLSARGAEVTVAYPGGVAGLSQLLAANDLHLENRSGGWILRSF